jgi:glycosyltransferase involved in cell wall biosynthesis
MTAPEKRFSLLFISSDKFPPYRVDVSILFAKEMVGRGNEIDWILQSENDLKKNCHSQWHGGKVWLGATNNGTSLASRFNKHILGIFNDFQLFSLAGKKHYHGIQVKDKFVSALLAIIAAKINKTKFIYWLSYPFPEASLTRAKDGTARYPLLYLFRGLIQKTILYQIIMPCADHIFVQSKQMKQDIMAMGITDKKITPVPMGVEIDKIPFTPLNSTAISKEKRIIYLGTLMKTRRIDFLLKVLAKLISKVPETRLFLIGGGDDPSDEMLLKDEAKRLGIDQAVVITGFLPMREAWDLVLTGEVCLSPFYPTFILNSTSPTKLIEYMAMGKAVVANDHPEQRIVLEESGGGHCVPYDINAFANAVTDLLIHPAKATEMGKKGRAYVEQHRTYTAIADAVEKKYMDIFFPEKDLT